MNLLYQRNQLISIVWRNRFLFVPIGMYMISRSLYSRSWDNMSWFNESSWIAACVWNILVIIFPNRFLMNWAKVFSMIRWFSWGFWCDSLKNLFSVFLKRLSFLSQSLVILRTSSFMLRRLSNLTLWKQIVSQSRIHSTTLFPLSLNYRAIIMRRENVQVIQSWELIYFWSRYIVLQTVSYHHFLRDFSI